MKNKKNQQCRIVNRAYAVQHVAAIIITAVPVHVVEFADQIIRKAGNALVLILVEAQGNDENCCA